MDDEAHLTDDSNKFEDESDAKNKEPEIKELLEERAKILKSMSKYEKKLVRGFMRSFSNAMILWLISKKRQHGYEIMTKLHEFSPHNEKMPSKIYPALHDLEKNGLIKGSWEHQGKRKIKYYEITDEGKQVFSRFKKLAKQARRDHSSLWMEFIEDIMSDRCNNEL